MTRTERWEKRNWFLMQIGYFAAGYLAINRFTSMRADIHNVSIPWDYSLPFMSVFILGYLLVYLSVIILYLLLDDIRVWRRAIISFMVCTTLAFAVFLIFPVEVSFRPDLTHADNGITMTLARWYFAIDEPYNAFPSIHIAFPVLCTVILWGQRRWWRWIMLAMTIVIAISVLLVKQHYILDVVGGAVTAVVSYALVLATERRWLPWLEKKTT